MTEARDIPPLFSALRATWPLLLGVAILVLGNGLQGSLLGVRAGLEGFTAGMTGLIMAGFYAGFLMGSLAVPKLVQRVGHVRVFGALASLASAAVLLHAIWLSVPGWIVIRLVTGFCFAGLYIVCESWLNDRATNETRGQLLAIYMVIVTGGMAAGQYLLTLADPGGFALFALISILISICLLPMMLGAAAQPGFLAPQAMTLKRLIRVSPAGTFGTFLAGLAHSVLLTLSVVYADRIGFDVTDIANFMAAMLLGAVLLQLPIGRLSDGMDRRRVILALSIVAAVACALLPWQEGATIWQAVLAAIAIGGMSFPLYAICVAYVNDYLEPQEMVAASSGLYVIYGVGATIGPLVAGPLMQAFGPTGFSLYLAIAHAILAAFVIYRMTVREAAPLDTQSPYAPMPLRAGQIAAQMNPDAELPAEAETPVQGGPMISPDPSQ